VPFMTMSVASLLRQHPWAEDVLQWHGVELDRLDPSLSLSAVCWLECLQPEVVVRDLLAAHPARDEIDALVLLDELDDEGTLEEVDDELPDAALWAANDPASWEELAS